jgi:hypothetical protein
MQVPLVTNPVRGPSSHVLGGRFVTGSGDCQIAHTARPQSLVTMKSLGGKAFELRASDLRPLMGS